MRINFTEKQLVELLSAMSKFKIESNTEITRAEKEVWKQFIDECKKGAQSET